MDTIPERTATALFDDLQRCYPGQFADGQVRTLQRRVKAWRAQAILQFDTQWLSDDLLPLHGLPRPLRATLDPVDQPLRAQDPGAPAVAR